MKSSCHRYLLPFGGVTAVAGAVALLGLMRLPAAADPAPQATYIGSAACKSCHLKVAQEWPTTAHAATLANPQLPPEQRECEACHGPGSLHAQSTGKQPVRNPAKLKAGDTASLCGACHFTGSAMAGAPILKADQWKRSGHARNEQSCTTCHTVHGKTEHALKTEPGQLCTMCHSNLARASGNGVVHAPVKAGQCLLCHDPHGSTRAHNVKDDIANQCAVCHAPATEKMKSAHKGYNLAGADCTRCHDPHSVAADTSYLRTAQHPPFAQGNCQICHTAPPSPELKKSVADTCYTCHPKEKVLAQTDASGTAIYSHPPVTAGLCTNCHEPHASSGKDALLRSDAVDTLCISCHKSIGAAQMASHQHLPVAKGECLTCHDGHGTVQPALLRQAEDTLCQQCHQDQAMHAHPTGVKDPNTGQTVTCASCHGLHGSDYEKLLRQPETKLCLSCHRMSGLSE